MRKQKIFKMIDLALVFNITIFIGVAITSWNEAIVISIIMVVFGAVNILFLATTIRLRVHYNYQLSKEIQIESEAEEMIDDEGKALYIKTKQNHLENIIEIKIKEAFPNSKVLKNCYVPQSRGDYSQIDLIFIHTKGMFVVEAKNVTGTITGNWNEPDLKLLHRGGKTYEMFNPLFQNDMHIKRLKDVLGRATHQFYNVVVFGDTTYIDIPLKGIPSNARISVISKLIDNIKALMNKSSLSLSDGELKVIYDDLLQAVKPNEEKENKHIERIKTNQSK